MIINAAGAKLPKKVQRIPKLEAAERQLAAAARLFFEDRDMLPVVNLAAAGSQILADLLKAKRLPSLIRGGAAVFEHRRSEFFERLRDPENFLKHANFDPERVLEFHPDFADFWLLSAKEDYYLLTGTMTWPLLVHSIWFASEHPDLVIKSEQTACLRELIASAPVKLTKSLALHALDNELEDWRGKWVLAPGALDAMHDRVRSIVPPTPDGAGRRRERKRRG